MADNENVTTGEKRSLTNKDTTTTTTKKKKGDIPAKKKPKTVPTTTMVSVERSFVANAIAYTKNQQYAKKVWNSLDPDLQNNCEIAFTALKRGAITFNTLPQEIRDNKEFLMQGIQENMFMESTPKTIQTRCRFRLKSTGSSKQRNSRPDSVCYKQRKVLEQGLFRNSKEKPSKLLHYQYGAY